MTEIYEKDVKYYRNLYSKQYYLKYIIFNTIGAVHSTDWSSLLHHYPGSGIMGRMQFLRLFYLFYDDWKVSMDLAIDNSNI